MTMVTQPCFSFWSYGNPWKNTASCIKKKNVTKYSVIHDLVLLNRFLNHCTL